MASEIVQQSSYTQGDILGNLHAANGAEAAVWSNNRSNRTRNGIMENCVYVLPPDGELVFPGSEEHKIMAAMQGMSQSQQRKLLTLADMLLSGELREEQILGWTDQQRREFVEALPESID